MEFLTNPIDWWIDPFIADGSLRTALWAALLAVLATSVVGTWVVLRGMSFLSDALAHGVLPGIAIAFVLGFNTTVGGAAAALVMVGGVSLVRTYSPLPDDTSIGVLFVGFLALAVVIMSTQPNSAIDLNDFLFGSVENVENGDVVRQAVAAAISVAGVGLFYRAFLVMTFDETQAQLLGLRPRLAHAALLVLLAVSIVASFETVGSLLVFAFLVVPPAAASLVVRRIPVIMATAVGMGAVAVVVGLLVSYHHGTAAGATMALASVTIFFAVLAGRTLGSALAATRRADPASP